MQKGIKLGLDLSLSEHLSGLQSVILLGFFEIDVLAILEADRTRYNKKDHNDTK